MERLFKFIKNATGLDDADLNGEHSIATWFSGNTSHQSGYYNPSKDSKIVQIADTTFQIELRIGHDYNGVTDVINTGNARAALTDRGQGKINIAGAHKRHGANQEHLYNYHNGNNWTDGYGGTIGFGISSSPAAALPPALYSGHGHHDTAFTTTNVTLPGSKWGVAPLTSHDTNCAAYTSFSGTSCATPVLAGILALYLEAETGATPILPSDAKAWLENSTTGASKENLTYIIEYEELPFGNITAVGTNSSSANAGYFEIYWPDMPAYFDDEYRINIFGIKADSTFENTTGVTADADYTSAASAAKRPLNWVHRVDNVDQTAKTFILYGSNAAGLFTHVSPNDINITHTGNFKIGVGGVWDSNRGRVMHPETPFGTLEGRGYIFTYATHSNIPDYDLPEDFVQYEPDDTSAPSTYFPYFPLTETTSRVAFLPYQNYTATWTPSATITVKTSTPLTATVSAELKTDLGEAPFAPTYSISANPPWLTINSTTGQLIGTVPAGPATYTVDVQADNGYYTNTQQYTLNAVDYNNCVNEPLPGGGTANGNHGEYYEDTSGCTAPATRKSLCNDGTWEAWSPCLDCSGTSMGIWHFDDTLANSTGSASSLKDDFWTLTTGIADAGPHAVFPLFLVYGDPKLKTDQVKFSGTGKSSLYFDAVNNSRIKLPMSNELAIDASPNGDDYTIDAWFRFEDLTNNQVLFSLVAQGITINSTHWYETLYYHAGDNKLKFFAANIESSAVTLTDNSNGGSQVWHHIAWTREYNPSQCWNDDCIKVYVDGVNVIDDDWSPKQVNNTGQGYTFWIGAHGTSSNNGHGMYPFKGWIDELRVVKGSALTDFTPIPPAVPCPAVPLPPGALVPPPPEPPSCGLFARYPFPPPPPTAAVIDPN